MSIIDALIRGLRAVIDNPLLRISVGATIVFLGLRESDSVFHEIASGNFGAHHGVILIGLSHILQALPDFFSGLEYMIRRPKLH